jgi:Lon protease-like protein
MTNFIPIFPLALVAYPGEGLNLHIFEPRYKQLIKDCFETKIAFGIPSVIDGKIKEKGTLMEIEDITKIYEDGKMDVKTRGIRIFNMLELIKEIPEKLYSGAIVTYQPNYNNGSAAMMKNIIQYARSIHNDLELSKNFGKSDDELCSYDLAHHIGMSIEEEYQLLEYENELHRQEFLKRHLTKLLPVVQEITSLKKKIKLNGHFKNIEGFSF